MLKTSFQISIVSAVMVAVSGCGSASDAEYSASELNDEPTAVTREALGEDAYIGVIPNDPEKGCLGWPATEVDTNSEIFIKFDSENEDNANLHNGWIGAFESGKNMKLTFCRVPAAGFKVPKGDKDDTYAVLKLSDKCPTGSNTLIRYFDCEDDDGIGRCTSFPFNLGPHGPSREVGCGNIELHLCVFEASASGNSRPFPKFTSVSGNNLRYGVLGGGGKPGFGGGFVYSDDEDDSNKNWIEQGNVRDYSAVIQPVGNRRGDDENTFIYTKPTVPDPWAP
jgi:hypothetical protein